MIHGKMDLATLIATLIVLPRDMKVLASLKGLANLIVLLLDMKVLASLIDLRPIDHRLVCLS